MVPKTRVVHNTEIGFGENRYFRLQFTQHLENRAFTCPFCAKNQVDFIGARQLERAGTVKIIPKMPLLLSGTQPKVQLVQFTHNNSPFTASTLQDGSVPINSIMLGSIANGPQTSEKYWKPTGYMSA
jgi:hypothetical protein